MTSVSYAAAPPPPPPPAFPVRRSIGDVIRRGFDNAVANWPLLLIRVGETFVFGAISVAAALAIIVPLLVSAGMGAFNPADATTFATTALTLITEHWLVIIWALVVVALLLVAFFLIHSFVIGGVATILVDAEIAAGPAPASRARFGAFTMERWMAGGRAHWWAVFWIYNVAYGVAALIVLVPLVVMGGIMILLHGSPAAIVAGCLGLSMAIAAGIFSAVIASIWCQKAIVVRAARGCTGSDALRIAWAEARADAGRHFAVAFVLMVIAFGGAGVIGMFSIVLAVPTAAIPMAGIFFMPLRILISMIQSAFSAAAANWMLASFAALSD